MLMMMMTMISEKMTATNRSGIGEKVVDLDEYECMGLSLNTCWFNSDSELNI